MLCVKNLDAKPNPMFSEELLQAVRFLRYSRAIPCVACGKKVRIHWTMLCEFKAVDFENSHFVTRDYPQVFAPLTPVCSDHPLHPAWKK